MARSPSVNSQSRVSAVAPDEVNPRKNTVPDGVDADSQCHRVIDDTSHCTEQAMPIEKWFRVVIMIRNGDCFAPMAGTVSASYAAVAGLVAVIGHRLIATIALECDAEFDATSRIS